jgi:hypothetical protein
MQTSETFQPGFPVVESSDRKSAAINLTEPNRTEPES